MDNSVSVRISNDLSWFWMGKYGYEYESIRWSIDRWYELWKFYGLINATPLKRRHRNRKKNRL
ncbi:unnamed protein product [Toxocara canis]|uniref:GNAT family acetyltransferase n=1 Tax=Toxocara canis TaxID=6265 RepID=A0A183VGH0_TOXCA|nr:unnamed protein product [Toxocara canis]